MSQPPPNNDQPQQPSTKNLLLRSKAFFDQWPKYLQYDATSAPELKELIKDQEAALTMVRFVRRVKENKTFPGTKGYSEAELQTLDFSNMLKLAWKQSRELAAHAIASGEEDASELAPQLAQLERISAMAEQHEYRQKQQGNPAQFEPVEDSTENIANQGSTGSDSNGEGTNNGVMNEGQAPIASLGSRPEWPPLYPPGQSCTASKQRSRSPPSLLQQPPTQRRRIGPLPLGHFVYEKVDDIINRLSKEHPQRAPPVSKLRAKPQPAIKTGSVPTPSMAAPPAYGALRHRGNLPQSPQQGPYLNPNEQFALQWQAIQARARAQALGQAIPHWVLAMGPGYGAYPQSAAPFNPYTPYMGQPDYLNQSQMMGSTAGSSSEMASSMGPAWGYSTIPPAPAYSRDINSASIGIQGMLPQDYYSSNLTSGHLVPAQHSQDFPAGSVQPALPSGLRALPRQVANLRPSRPLLPGLSQTHVAGTRRGPGRPKGSRSIRSSVVDLTAEFPERVAVPTQPQPEQQNQDEAKAASSQPQPDKDD